MTQLTTREYDLLLRFLAQCKDKKDLEEIADRFNTKALITLESAAAKVLRAIGKAD